MASPTPLPIFDSASLDPKDPERALRSLATTLENLLIYLSRTRDVLFDTSAEDSLGAQIASLSSSVASAVKHIYVLPIGVPVVVAPGDPGLDHLDTVAGTLVEVRLRAQTPAAGAVSVALLVDGVARGTVTVPQGQTVGSLTTFTDATLGQDQQLTLVVTAAPADAGTGWVGQVRAR